MIAALRVDERLIHGQISLSWSKTLKIKGIVVANNKAAADDMQKMMLKMAAPSELKTIVLSVDNAIELLNDERSKQMRLLVITTTVKDALAIAEGVDEKPEQVNIGNAGKMGAKGNEIMLTKEVCLSQTEIEYLKQLVEEFPDTYFQGTPNMEKHSGKEVLQKIDK